MGTETTLDDVLNNIINQYENQIAHCPDIEEKRALEKLRNEEIVRCLRPMIAAALNRNEEIATAFIFHDSIHSGMTAAAVQSSAGMLLDAKRYTSTRTGDVVTLEILILVANLAARLHELQEKVGGG